ncbi:bacillithiol system redox-active protein YtxJ [Flavobacteriales bacterium]|nr:bacillithiol system redox-active protein YtxJ [Flavobacteriales bacterium]
MGLFGFGGKEKKEKMSWSKISSEKELDEAIALSHEKPVMLFKHSTRCSISSMALSRIESEWGFSQEEIVPFYLDLIAHREVSNAIASKLNVFHASPQMILVKEGKSVMDASHNEIRASLVKELV